MQEECGVECAVGELVAVHDDHFDGTAPTGRHEDFHGVHLVFAATAARRRGAARWPRSDGTTDAVAWVPVGDIAAGRLPVLDVVRHALEAAG